MKDLNEHERPPIFKSWDHWYAIVLGFMILQVVLYLILTYSFK